MDTFEETFEDEHPPSQMHTHSTNRRQWEERISSEKVREQWGDVETITEKLMKRRLEWLGHLAQTPNCRIPKMCLFGWLPLPGWYQGLVRGLIC